MKTTILTFLAALSFTALNAQKLPTIQQNSLTLPGGLKIDGKADEWKTFEAYNNATDVFYSVANNGKALYFIIKTNSYNITNKVIRGGITLTINPEQKKDFAGVSEITFPIVEPNDLRAITLSMREVLENTEASQEEKLLAATNKQLASGIRFIKTKSLKTVKDSLISIYNEHEVKAAAALTGKGILTCEFEIPLELLNLKTNKFAYNIKLNGPKLRPVMVRDAMPDAPASNSPTTVFKGQGVVTADNMTRQQTEMVASTMSTDFWAEYTLAK